ncbi:MAG: phosphopantothenoylcysteine decarboxylase [Anaerolineales bacterium]|nr:phosphopantothenoylcysteine decarboxylase [Anaerolineales bacterium]
MDDWDFSPPPQSPLQDREVPLDGSHLEGKRVALLLTGGIAAIKAPLIVRALRRQSASVVVFASDEAMRYTTLDALEWSSNNPVITRLTAAAEHISDSAPFDAYLLAPATYNTINKIARGIADNQVTTTLAVAIGRMERGLSQLLLAPTMHGYLHNSLLTASLRKLAGIGVRIIPPHEDYGKHKIPSEERLVAEVCRATNASPLKALPILVTGGPAPTPIDSVRQIGNRFSGQLGIEIATELHLRGADALLIHGSGSAQPHDWLPHNRVSSYDEYRAAVMQALQAKPFTAGVFSAAVVDFSPESALPGKTPSNDAISLRLVPTEKIIAAVSASFPELYMVTFKYQEDISHQELIEISRERVQAGYPLVVANRGEEKGPHGEQVAHLVTAADEAQKAVGKAAIARTIADHLEGALATEGD